MLVVVLAQLLLPVEVAAALVELVAMVWPTEPVAMVALEFKQTLPEH
jgi:hypothetical protein